MTDTTALSEGVYFIRNEASGTYATVQPGAGEKQGAKVVLEERRAEEGTARHAQLWHIRPNAAREGAWTIQNVRSTLRIDIMAGRDRAGAAVQQCPAESRDDLLVSQLWRPEPTAADVYVWRNVNSGKNLAVRGESHQPGAHLEQANPRDEQDRGTQLWRLERAPALGEAKGFDALTASVVSGRGGAIGAALTGLTGLTKGVLDAGGGVFETMAKVVPDPKAPYLRFDGFRGDEFIRFSQRHGIETGPEEDQRAVPAPARGLPRRLRGRPDRPQAQRPLPRGHRPGTRLGVLGALGEHHASGPGGAPSAGRPGPRGHHRRRPGHHGGAVHGHHRGTRRRDVRAPGHGGPAAARPGRVPAGARHRDLVRRGRRDALPPRQGRGVRGRHRGQARARPGQAGRRLPLPHRGVAVTPPTAPSAAPSATR
ncbi:RICIN domain-containing protein [Streptomyces sp. PmtG]